MTNEQKEIITRLRRQGVSYGNIGKAIGASKEAVRGFCRRNGVEATVGVFKDAFLCRECGKPIMQKPKRKKQIFCCKTCREKWWKEHPEKIKQRAVYSFKCKYCGKAFTAYGNSNRKYCSHNCYIKDRFGGGTDE